MQEHHFSFEIEAEPDEVWAVFWALKHKGQVIEHGSVRIEILHPGDATGEGLIRHCRFRVPHYLLSGGVGRSWEWLSEVRPGESWRYDAVGKPLYSKASGTTRLEALPGGRTRVHFSETYHAFNPLLRMLLERAVHRFISRDNDVLMKNAIERGVRALRKSRRGRAADRSLTA
jgi:hypothetical protein